MNKILFAAVCAMPVAMFATPTTLTSTKAIPQWFKLSDEIWVDEDSNLHAWSDYNDGNTIMCLKHYGASGSSSYCSEPFNVYGLVVQITGTTWSLWQQYKSTDFTIGAGGVDVKSCNFMIAYDSTTRVRLTSNQTWTGSGASNVAMSFNIGCTDGEKPKARLIADEGVTSLGINGGLNAVLYAPNNELGNVDVTVSDSAKLWLVDIIDARLNAKKLVLSGDGVHMKFGSKLPHTAWHWPYAGAWTPTNIVAVDHFHLAPHVELADSADFSSDGGIYGLTNLIVSGTAGSTISGSLTFTQAVNRVTFATSGASLEFTTTNSIPSEIAAGFAVIGPGTLKVRDISPFLGTIDIGSGSSFEHHTTDAGESVLNAALAGTGTFSVNVAGSLRVPYAAIVGFSGSVVANAGALTVEVDAGNTLNLQSVPATSGSGTIDFVVGSRARVVCASAAGTTPAGVTLNGTAATFRADGRLVPADGYAATVEIAARGGVVADNVAGVTGITTDGDPSDGPVTLTAGSVEVGALVQKAFADATVSMPGKTLAASTLVRTAASGAFTIGSAAGEGAVTSDALLLDNADALLPLTVNARLEGSSGAIRKIGVGDAELAALKGSWAITNEQGRLVVGGSSRAEGLGIRLTNMVGRSVFEIAGDACVTGSMSFGYSSGKAAGFAMRDGYFRSQDDFVVEGCVEIFGGHFVSDRFFVGRHAHATYVQHGGEANVGSGTDMWIPWYGSTGIGSALRIKGGKMTYGHGIATCGTSSQNAKITVEGGEFVINGTVYVSANNWGRTWFNFNGGVAEVQNIRNHRNVAWYNGNQGRFYVSFNGGTVRLGKNNLSVFGRPVVSDTDYYPARLITVCEKGAIIDTNGKTGNTIDVPITKPTGQGIVSVPLSAPITGLSGAPYVSITDANSEAMGASAECDYDAASGSVTNITVTSPGVNYTTAKVALRYGSGNLKTGIACTLGEIAGGPFTKAGLGDLTLNATNTWAGGTVVSGGVLVCGCDWALPTNTAVRLAGGTLDLNGKQALISSLEVVPNAGATLTGATSGVLPASMAVAGDVQALRGHSLRLLSVPDGFPDGVPAVTSNDDDPHWMPVCRNGLLRLVWADGMVITFR